MTAPGNPNPLVNAYPTSDERWLYIVCLQPDRYWSELCGVLDRKDLETDERFATMEVRGANARACIAEFDSTFRSRTLDEWREAFAGFTGVWAAALNPAEVHDHVQVDPNGFLAKLTANDGSEFRLPVPPMQFGGEAPVPQGPAPEVGQHTEELLLELGRDWDAIGTIRASGTLG